MDYKKAVQLYKGAKEWPRCGQDWGTYPQESEAKSLLDGVATRYAQALINRAEMARLVAHCDQDGVNVVAVTRLVAA